MSAISVQNLSKSFRVKKQTPGFSGTLKSFFKPDWQDVTALDNISFSIERGERVAFIGPNGAGKSTTIKILSGILNPSQGEVNVAGLTSWEERQKLSYEIGTVFGQRSQLWYHLPARDSFTLLASAYGLDKDTYASRLSQLTDAFDIADLLDKPVRQMSLGQRMRCEVVASFLHKPAILFLDEPTVGLDVSAKSVIRDLVYETSIEDGTTILLTSHDTGDMERVCDRVILIDEGQIVIDAPVSKLRSSYISRKIITLHMSVSDISFEMQGVEIAEKAPHKMVLNVDTSQQNVSTVIEKALLLASMRDISIEDPPMEDVLRSIYKNGQG